MVDFLTFDLGAVNHNQALRHTAPDKAQRAVHVARHRA
jgi:hypothetical protein